MKPIADNFAAALDQLLEQIGTERFIELSGFDKSTVSQWKNAQRGPGDSALFKLQNNVRLPHWFRETCGGLMRHRHGMLYPSPPHGPATCPTYPIATDSFDLGDGRDHLRDHLDADGDGDADLDDARIHSQRATAILERVTKSDGGRR